MKELKTEIIINSTPGKIYQVLIDLDRYAEWNPFVIRSSGRVAVGETLTNTMLNGTKEMTFKPVVTVVEPNKMFEWLGSGMMGMFKGRHYFILEDLGDGYTKLIHGEKFSGILRGLIMKMIGEDTLKGFKAMNLALKNRLEEQAKV